MAQTQKRLSLVVLPLIICVCSIVGGFYGPSVQIAAAATDPEAAVQDAEVGAFNRVYSLVDQNFADRLNPELIDFLRA